ncbi:MAG TPA: two-component regulator propeller domain-containing protein [Steroidobacteraceae bacterium]|nr:two-component regulator propeller domain-containing protein [Steroidobacteraceae bacterium]
MSGWRCLPIAWLMAAAGTAPAAESPSAPPVVFDHLTTADGLPQGTVYATLQDSQGFVWLGTEDGLIRYDGHELFRYGYNRAAREGLPGNFIQGIVEDSHHDLWIAVVDSGLARWNRASDTFTVYRHDPLRPDSLASDAVRTLLVDEHGRIWVGMRDAGIDIVDPVTGHIEHRQHHPSRSTSLADNRVKVLSRDASGVLWVGTENGLDRLLPDGKSFAHYRHSAAERHSLSSDNIAQIYHDHAGSMWIGTFDGGVNRMDASGQVTAVYRHDPRTPASLAHDDVRAILEDQAGHLWIGTADGLDLLDRNTGRFTHYRHDERDATSMRDSFVMSLYEDTSGLVWVGTRAGGVSRWNPHSWDLGGRRPDWLQGKLVTAFADAPDHRVWIASLGGGLVRFDPATGEKADFDSVVGRRNALGDQRVMSLEGDRHGTLWIGTYTSGVVRLTPDGHVNSIQARFGDPRSLSAAGIMTIYEAKDGRIWFGTHGGGANVLDVGTGLIRQLPFESMARGATSGRNVTSFAEDRNGNMWMGTDGGGLNLARPDGLVFKVFRHDPDNERSLSANTVYGITVDNDGRLWIATEGGGLDLVVGSSAAPDAIRFNNISRADGLTSDTIYGVLADGGGRLWMSGNSGLMRYDPRNRSVKTFHLEQGLYGEEFDLGAYRQLRDGRFCFGGPGGFNIFDPSGLVENSQPPRLALMQVDVLGAPMRSSTPYWLLDHIDVDSHAAIVSLDFGTLDFTSPKRNRLAYRMPGLTDNWIDLGTQHQVTLTNLDSGDHILEVRAASADSVWGASPLRIKIHRDPAPWKSFSAFAGYAFLAACLVTYGMWNQRRKIRLAMEAQARLEAEVEARTKDLVASNRLLEEAAQAKSAFLARMTHELRTPMNGVVGMTELLERTALSSDQVRLTKTIRSSADVLLQIVNHLLDLSKAQAGKIELETVAIDLGLILEESAAIFAGAAAGKGLDLTVCPPGAVEHALFGDPLRIRQIVINLIGNAVKFTDHGHVVVEANIGESINGRSSVEIIVRDTGIGMAYSAVEKIFEPFAQADESTTRRFGGTGLGLAICRELATLMGGTVGVESRPGVGSVFRIVLALKIGDRQAPDSATPQLKGRVRIMTHRTALAEALRRHALSFGLGVVGDDDGSAAPVSGVETLTIVDAATHLNYLRSRLVTADVRPPRLVIIASAEEAEMLGVAPLIGNDVLVAPPVQRADLYRAIASSLGMAEELSSLDSSNSISVEKVPGHVLVVDDEPVNAEVAQGYLAALGCTSVWVQDGAAAVARCSAERFDAILMDISMPVMDGFATTILIRESKGPSCRTPIVALTAHDAESHLERCLAGQMNDLIEKPYTFEACAAILRRWIKRGRGLESEERQCPRIAGAAVPSVDRAVVSALRNLPSRGQEDLYATLVRLFQASAGTALVQLRASLAAGDLQAAGATSHKLRASAANVGAMSFAAGLRELENLCNSANTVASLQQLAALEAGYPILLEELHRLALKATA